MKTLIVAIQDALQGIYSDLNLKKEKAVYICVDDRITPPGVIPPCIGIKDGDTVREETFSDRIEIVYTVNIFVLCDLPKDEQKIIGNETKDKPGVLDMCYGVIQELDNNLLDIDGLYEAFCSDISASVAYGNVETGDFFQLKTLTYRYKWNGLRSEENV
jgi:hypothetical protein